MLGPVAHVGITVRDFDKALAFYEGVLGMEKLAEATFSGAVASRLTRIPGTVLRAAYLRGGKGIKGPPLELLHFVEPGSGKGTPYSQLNNPGITEVAFWVDDIEQVSAELMSKGVEFYSPPQLFEFGGSKAKAVYFLDPDGTTLELIQTVRD
jgi:catechol 2,3-dioxygenase-like lactoylglutathione lyase family enzyme